MLMVPSFCRNRDESRTIRLTTGVESPAPNASTRLPAPCAFAGGLSPASTVTFLLDAVVWVISITSSLTGQVGVMTWPLVGSRSLPVGCAPQVLPASVVMVTSERAIGCS